jgi:hypothetical protein
MRHPSRKPGARDGSEPYDEPTFRYLLGLEQRRSDRSGRPFVLIVVDVNHHSDEAPYLDEGVAASIFAGLSRCLRETDFFGWYEHRVRAGAVLTELGEGEQTDVRKLLDDKVMTRGLLQHLRPEVAARLRIQVSRYPELDLP